MKASKFIFPVLLLLRLEAEGFEANAVELELGQLVTNHPNQERAEMVYSPVLSMVARAKALDLGTRDYAAHVDPDGYGPNKACELAGWGLPAWYDQWLGANNVESLTGGNPSAAATFASWVASTGHQEHLLGMGGYVSQTRYGFGYAHVPGSTFGHYYVFLSAPPSTTGSEAFEPYVEWLFGLYTLKQIDLAGDDGDGDGDGIPRILEFALNYDPEHLDLLPAPVLTAGGTKLEWTLTPRPDLGTMQVVVKRSQDLQTWTETGVSRVGDTFSIDVGGAKGFLRCECGR